jgi:Holliday junction resolvase-like predicted endonuclease
MDVKSIGKIGENYAKEFLTQNGYKILATNQQFNINKKKLGEIDIIAQLDNVTYIFEVKTRRDTKFGLATESVTAQKLQTLYTITEFLAAKYEIIRLQLIAIQVYNAFFEISINDLY